MNTYKELKEKYYESDEGVFYAFSREQFEKGMIMCGYDENTKLLRNDMGGFGTKEAFKKREERLKAIKKEIQEKCTPEEIYKYEFVNYECGYTGDDSEAVEMVRLFFKDFEPKELFNELFYREEA